MIMVLWSLSCQSEKVRGLISSEIEIDGLKRQYLVYLPDSLPENAPLVFVIHGFTDNAENMMNTTGMNAVADREKFAICYPQGLKEKEGRTFWNVGYAFTQDQTHDDVKFLKALAAQLQDQYHLNRVNTFAAGMSNGAEMCMLLACKAPDIFSAVVPVCGCFVKSTFDSLTIATPIPVLMMNGTADNTTSWEGDMENKQGWGAYLPVRTSFDFFVKGNGCSEVTIDTLPDTNTADGSYVIAEKHSGGINSNQVWLYTVVNGSHDWPGSSGNMDISASEEAWTFFNLFIQK